MVEERDQLVLGSGQSVLMCGLKVVNEVELVLVIEELVVYPEQLVLMNGGLVIKKEQMVLPIGRFKVP